MEVTNFFVLAQSPGNVEFLVKVSGTNYHGYLLPPTVVNFDKYIASLVLIFKKQKVTVLYMNFYQTTNSEVTKVQKGTTN